MNVNVDVGILITLFFGTNFLFNKMIKKKHVNKNN
jgi:hypothetical protein